MTLVGRPERRDGHAPGDAAREDRRPLHPRLHARARFKTLRPAGGNRAGDRGDLARDQRYRRSARSHRDRGQAATRSRAPSGSSRGRARRCEYDFRYYLGILALISLSLALLNLLPLLPLDGGHIAFTLIEGIRGRAVPRIAYERASVIGIALVLMLFFLGVSNDVNRLGGG